MVAAHSTRLDELDDCVASVNFDKMPQKVADQLASTAALSRTGSDNLR